VQQLVKPTRRPTAWTGKTGQRAEETAWEERRLARLKHKEKYAAGGDGKPKHKQAYASIDYLINTHELKNYHETLSGETGLAAFDGSVANCQLGAFSERGTTKSCLDELDDPI
jgi:hypothetical protein